MLTVLISGATGNVGRPLIDDLLAAGARVRALSRYPQNAALPAGVEVVASATSGLSGTDAVFVNSRALGPDLAGVVAQAVAEGVTKLVALSAINVDDDLSRQPSRYRGDRNREAEQVVAAAGLPWVSLRPAVFASNFAGMWDHQIRAGDIVSGPYAQASNAPIVEADIAAVAARALLTDDLDGQRIAMTGPQALTCVEMVQDIAEVLHRPLRYLEVAADVVRKRFSAIGFPAAFADAYIAMQAQAAEGPALVTHEVEKILGRPPTSFSQWVAEHRDLFA